MVIFKEEEDCVVNAEYPIHVNATNNTYAILAIKEVLKEESHLFSAKEISFLNHYVLLPIDALNLHFSLLNNRIWKWERVSMLKYNPNLIDVLNSHSGFQVFDLDGPENLTLIFPLLQKPELQQLCGKYRISHKGKKVSELPQLLIKSLKTQRKLNFSKTASNDSFVVDLLYNEIKNLIGPVVKLETKCRDLFHKIYVIYFRTAMWPNEDKFMVKLIRSDILPKSNPAKLNHVPFKVSRFALFWATRYDFLEYFRALKLEYNLISESENNEISWNGMLIKTEQCFEKWSVIIKDDSEHVTGISWFQRYTSGILKNY